MKQNYSQDKIQQYHLYHSQSCNAKVLHFFSFETQYTHPSERTHTLPLWAPLRDWVQEIDLTVLENWRSHHVRLAIDGNIAYHWRKFPPLWDTKVSNLGFDPNHPTTGCAMSSVPYILGRRDTKLLSKCCLCLLINVTFVSKGECYYSIILWYATWNAIIEHF
jgi:hypothetical protein